MRHVLAEGSFVNERQVPFKTYSQANAMDTPREPKKGIL
jgi:hypothetical protein